MRAHLTHAGMAAVAAAAQRPPQAARFVFDVKVTLESGQVEKYTGVYAHTFDAYDAAFVQFPTCTRVEAKVCGLKPARSAHHHDDRGVQ
ncbi:MAG: hypothetical protein RL375_849 [Pseudomonadota bacterium]|jgi:hypothetical protein